jgi:hypothetical protein
MTIAPLQVSLLRKMTSSFFQRLVTARLRSLPSSASVSCESKGFARSSSNGSIGLPPASIEVTVAPIAILAPENVGHVRTSSQKYIRDAISMT